MSITTAKPTSRRGYLSQDELEQYADITVTDTAEADDRISLAEEIIDTYVGYQDVFLKEEITGRCANAGGAATLYLDSDQVNVYQNDYFKGCEVEILGGTGEGQRKKITASVYTSGLVTVDSNWTTAPDSTSFYKIYQLGKFPRREDVKYYTDQTPYTYYKSIPEAVKRAVAAQVEYMIKMGDDYFNSDKSRKQSESISKYSYTLADGVAHMDRLIAPKAKALLSAVRNRVGTIA